MTTPIIIWAVGAIFFLGIAWRDRDELFADCERSGIAHCFRLVECIVILSSLIWPVTMPVVFITRVYTVFKEGPQK